MAGKELRILSQCKSKTFSFQYINPIVYAINLISFISDKKCDNKPELPIKINLSNKLTRINLTTPENQ